MAGDQVDKLIDPSTSDEGSSGAKTARSLDLDIPRDLLLVSDEVIE